MALQLKDTLLKSTTSLSINERFTQLRGNRGRAMIQSHRDNIRRENNAREHQASIKNRRLAQQMECRPTVMAALKIKKKSLRQRLGLIDNGISVQDRLMLPGPSRVQSGGRGRGRGRGRGLVRGRGGLRNNQNQIFESRRGTVITKSQRGQGSLQPQRSAWRSRGTTGRLTVLASPRGVRRATFPQRSRMYLQRQNQDKLQLRHLVGHQPSGQLQGSRLQGNRLRGSRLNGSQQRGRQQRGRQPRGRQPPERQPPGRQPRGSQPRGSQPRGRQRGSQPRGSQPRGSQPRGRQLLGSQLRGRQLRGRQRTRGQLRGGQLQQGKMHGGQLYHTRGSFRGRSRVPQFNHPKPSKEELDMELDQYMANTKAHLNHQLDSYMNRDPADSWR